MQSRRGRLYCRCLGGPISLASQPRDPAHRRLPTQRRKVCHEEPGPGTLAATQPISTGNRPSDGMAPLVSPAARSPRIAVPAGDHAHRWPGRRYRARRDQQRHDHLRPDDRRHADRRESHHQFQGRRERQPGDDRCPAAGAAWRQLHAQRQLPGHGQRRVAPRRRLRAASASAELAVADGQLEHQFHARHHRPHGHRLDRGAVHPGHHAARHRHGHRCQRHSGRHAGEPRRRHQRQRQFFRSGRAEPHDLVALQRHQRLSTDASLARHQCRTAVLGATAGPRHRRGWQRRHQRRRRVEGRHHRHLLPAGLRQCPRRVVLLHAQQDHLRQRIHGLHLRHDQPDLADDR